MILEFEEIIDNRFTDEVKNIKNKVKNSFKKEETFKEGLIRRKIINILGCSFVSIILTFVINILGNFNNIIFNFLFFASLFVLLFSIFYGLFLEEKYEKEENKIKLPINNIIGYYKMKKRNISAKRVNKKLNNLNKKQKEIIKFINDNRLYEDSSKRIQKEILKKKINNCSALQLKLNKNILMDFINNLEDKKTSASLENLINKRIKCNVSLFEEEKIIKEGNRILIL